MDKIQVSLILEILGRPPDNVKEALRTVVTKIDAEKGVKIIKKTYHEPKPVENSNLFTAFADLDLELESVSHYFMLIFTYFPSHIEITYPEKPTLSNADINELGQAILQRLHQYDALMKNNTIEREDLLRKIQSDAPNLFAKLVKQVKEKQAKDDQSPQQTQEQLSEKEIKEPKKSKKKAKKK